MSKRGQETNYMFISVIAVKHKPNFLGKKGIMFGHPIPFLVEMLQGLIQSNTQEVDEEMWELILVLLIWHSFYFQWSCMDVKVGLWRKLSAKELMSLNCGVGEDSWESPGLQGDPTSPFQKRSALGFLWNSNTLATSCEELTHWKRL